MSYRAAILENPAPGGYPVPLTGPEHAHLSDADLFAEAWAEAQHAGLIGDAYPCITRDQFMAWTRITEVEDDPAWVWSVEEAAAAWGVSTKRVRQYLAQGRVPGAVQLGRDWAIPAHAPKPQDPRRTP